MIQCVGPLTDLKDLIVWKLTAMESTLPARRRGYNSLERRDDLQPDHLEVLSSSKMQVLLLAHHLKQCLDDRSATKERVSQSTSFAPFAA